MTKLVRESLKDKLKGPTKEEILKDIIFDVDGRSYLRAYKNKKLLPQSELEKITQYFDIPHLELKVEYSKHSKRYALKPHYNDQEVKNINTSYLLNSDVLNEYYKKNSFIAEDFLMNLKEHLKVFERNQYIVIPRLPNIIKSYIGNLEEYDVMVPIYEKAQNEINDFAFKIIRFLQKKDFKEIFNLLASGGVDESEIRDIRHFFKYSDYYDKFIDVIWNKWKEFEKGRNSIPDRHYDFVDLLSKEEKYL